MRAMIQDKRKRVMGSTTSAAGEGVIEQHLAEVEPASLKRVPQHSGALAYHNIVFDLYQVEVHEIQAVNESVLSDPCTLYQQALQQP